MKSLFATFAFLTTIPIPVGLLDEQQDYKKCVPLFPIAGVVIGSMIALVAWGLVSVVPPLPAAVMITAAMAGISGALHLDGLADTTDGFLSGRPREQAMEIMHDSRIGAMGVVVLLLLLLLKVAVLSEICGMEMPYALGMVALAPVFGRCSLIWSMRLNPYARPDGLGRSYWHRSWVLSLVALAGVSALAFWLIGPNGLIGTGTVVCITLIFGLWCRRRIGGATGDTAGACCELTEAGFLLAVVSAVNMGVTL
ncbi:MAG: adenosylcobinamide-GDP ribazoletransferase [Planctomycetes bacterium]|nr:adenosylcobinamide-GDP ribazoletransferase [Planctomycetota bacterium]